MTCQQIEKISKEATVLAISEMDAEDMQFYEELGVNPYANHYNEYMEQLQSGDNQFLRTWLGWKIETGSLVAVEIMKMWIRAELAAS